VWSHRLRFELEAAARFERLSVSLEAHEAHPTVVRLCSQAGEDEHRHAELCARMVEHFGGRIGTTPEAPDDPVAPRHLSPVDALLYEVVSMCVITETLSTALLGGLVARATDDAVRTTLRAILRDEVMHSRIGWAHLAHCRQNGLGGAVGSWLPAMLAGTVEDELFVDREATEIDEEVAGLGHLTSGERLETFVATMRRVVFPGLRGLGIDAAPGERYLTGLVGPPSGQASASPG